MALFNSSYTLEDYTRLKPFGWTMKNPPVISTYYFESVVDPFHSEFILTYYKSFVIYVGLLYIITIFGLQKFMKNRPAFDLKMPLFYWNLTLGIFSIACFTRIYPGFMFVLQQPGGLYSSICLKKDMDIPTGFWCLMFLFSKFVELGDTIFIVLRKRPLVFLQWYHHLITMAVGWIMSPMMEPILRWIVILNAFVHSLMYPYFAFKGVGVKIPSIIANIITTLQLSQMIIALAINIASVYFLNAGYDCVRYSLSIKCWGFVYGSFTLLFGKLFYDSVWNQGHKKKMS